MKDLLLNILMGALKQSITLYLKAVLQKIQDNNSREVYENTLKSINSNFLLLDEVAKKTTTKVDDDAIEAVLAAVRQSADEDGVQL